MGGELPFAAPGMNWHSADKAPIHCAGFERQLCAIVVTYHICGYRNTASDYKSVI
jgi:hypothetical protein